MPEVTIYIGGRGFHVSCQEGEEAFLQSAAKMLDDEAQVSIGSDWPDAGIADACSWRG